MVLEMLEHSSESLVWGTSPKTKIQEEIICVCCLPHWYVVSGGWQHTVPCRIRFLQGLRQDKEKINNGEKKQSSHLLCLGATGQHVVNNVPEVRWPQCLERQIIELWIEKSRWSVGNIITHDRGSCIREALMAQRANRAILLPVGSCEPTSSHIAAHCCPAWCHAANWKMAECSNHSVNIPFLTRHYQFSALASSQTPVA